MILVDAAAVPDHPSGVRTRLRGLFAAYGQLANAPSVTVQVARGSRLFEDHRSGSVQVTQVDAAGGPWRRVFARRADRSPDLELWHTETMPGRGPAGVPQLLTLHDLRHHHSRRDVGGTLLGHLARAGAARLLMPGWLRRLAGVVTVSEASAQEIRRVFGLPDEAVHVVPNAATGLPLQSVTADPESVRQWMDGRPFFVAVGHLERRKQLGLLLEALVAAKGGTLEESALLLVGDGPERAALERAVAERGLEGRVHFTGPLPDASVAALLDAAVALLFPSLIEGFGFPVFEALGRSCPVIARPLPCLSEWSDGPVRRVTGDVTDWVRAMEQLLADPDAARDETRQATRMLDHHSWHHSAERLAQVWRSCLGQ